ncbi:MAG: iron-sulfur cluster assembly accessory protein [Pirellulales bacterium]|jgi:iron-sulfur cluster assembly protein
MSITLTERAAQEVIKARDAHKADAAMFLRIGVKGGGCSGFNYSMQFDSKFDESADSKFEFFGVEVVVDKKSALYLEGMTVDWYESLEQKGFKFDNPNATKTCGCGSSFSV